MPEAATVTIPGVELLKVGTWAASTGPVDVTAEHLADAVAAAQDPEVTKAPLKLGHTGALSELGDSAPGLGWVTNHRLSDDGQTLIGDLTDIPAGLEAPIRAGFKSRSAEIAWAVKTAAGKTYSAVIDGLALLGVQAPAIKSLADLPKLYEPAAALASAGLEAGSHSTLSLYDAIAQPTADDEITNQVKYAKQQVAQLAAITGIAGLQAAFDAIDAMAKTDSRGLLAGAPHAVPDPAPAHGGTMPDTTLKPEDLAKARALLGLGDDATDEQVTAKLSELNELVTAGKAPVADPEPKPTVEPKVPVAAFSADTIAELKAAGLSVIPTDVLDQVQAGATAGAEARSLLAAQSRDAVLEEAYRSGKFGAGDTAVKVRSTFSAQLDKDFEGTKAIIDALPALVPVGEIGHAGPGPDHTELSAADAAAWDKFEADVFGIPSTTPEA